MKNSLIYYLLFLLAACFVAVLFSGCNQKPAPAGLKTDNWVLLHGNAATVRE